MDKDIRDASAFGCHLGQPPSQPENNQQAFSHPRESSRRSSDQQSPKQAAQEVSAKRKAVVKSACDRCKGGKVKCDGRRPCNRCTSLSKECTYVIVDQRRTKSRRIDGISTTAPQATLSDHQSESSGREASDTLQRPNQASSSSFSEFYNSTNQLEAGTSSQAQDSRPSCSAMNQSQPFANIQFDINWNEGGGTTTGPITSSQVNSDTSRVIGLTTLPEGILMSPSLPINDPFTETIPSTQTVDSGDASGMGFLNRIHRHLTNTASLSSFPRGVSFERERKLDATTDLLFLPDKATSQSYVQCFFDHASVTYRYLDRRTIDDLLDRFYEPESQSSKDERGLVLLLVLSLGCLWSSSMKGVDLKIYEPQAVRLFRAAQNHLDKILQSMIPSLLMVKSYILMTQFHLALSRFQSAWLSLGMASRLGQLLGLHIVRNNLPYQEDQARKRVFWSMFMLDRYLSAVIGLPVLFDENEITQVYPDVLPGQARVSGESTPEDEFQALAGALEHIKLSRIIGHIVTRLYSPDKLSPERRKAIVSEIQMELDAWEEQAPQFFVPQSSTTTTAFFKLPHLFERQRRTVHGAYWYTKLFLYRSFLLEEFLQHLPNGNQFGTVHTEEMAVEVKHCVHAAMNIAQMAAEIKDNMKFNQTYWNAAYFTFCSITVLLVYLIVYEDAPDRHKVENVLEEAMKGHCRLTGSEGAGHKGYLEESMNMMDTLKGRATSMSTRLPMPNISGNIQATRSDVGNDLFFGSELSNLYSASNQHHQQNMDSGDIGLLDWDELLQNTQYLAYVGMNHGAY